MRCAWVGLAVAFPLAEAARLNSVKLTAQYSSTFCDGPSTFVEVKDATTCSVSKCSKSATGTTASTVCHSGGDLYSAVNDLFGATPFILRESYDDANCSTFRGAIAIRLDADCVHDEATGEFVRNQISSNGSISVQYFADSSCSRLHLRHIDYVPKATAEDHSCDSNALKWYVARHDHRSLSQMEVAIRLIFEEGEHSANTDTSSDVTPDDTSSAVADEGAGSGSDTTTETSSKSLDTAPGTDMPKSSDKGSNNAEPSPAPTPTQNSASPTTVPTPTTTSPATTTPPDTTSAPAPTQATHVPAVTPKPKTVSGSASASNASSTSVASTAPTSTTDTTTAAKKPAATDTSASGSSIAAPVSTGNSNASTFTLLGFAAGIIAIAIIILALVVRRVRTEDKSDHTPAPATARREVRDPYGMQTSPFQSQRLTQRIYTKLTQKPYLQQDPSDELEQQSIQSGAIQHWSSQQQLSVQQLSNNARGSISAHSSPSNPTEMWNDEVILASRISKDKLEVQERLGCGAFGEVYSGMYDRRRVAVKMLPPLMRPDVKQVNEFLAEAKRAATITHPHIVSLIGVAWNALSDACVVMEYMDGGDLRSLLSDYEATRHPVGFDNEKATIAMHVCQALAYMHSLATPIIHRDLKSRNILLNQAMEAKLTDFGISREKLDQAMTAGVGTSLWIAPEFLMGNNYDDKADIFSFGVVLSELDTHQLPYAAATNPGSGQTAYAVMLQKVVMGTLQVEFSQQGSQTMAELGRACTSVDPNKRPKAAEILYILQDVLSEELLECSL